MEICFPRKWRTNWFHSLSRISRNSEKFFHENVTWHDYHTWVVRSFKRPLCQKSCGFHINWGSHPLVWESNYTNSYLFQVVRRKRVVFTSQSRISCKHCHRLFRLYQKQSWSTTLSYNTHWVLSNDLLHQASKLNYVVRTPKNLYEVVSLRSRLNYCKIKWAYRYNHQSHIKQKV